MKIELYTADLAKIYYAVKDHVKIPPEDDKEIYMIYANSSKTSLWRTKRENIKYIRKISSCIITMVFG